MDDYIAISMLNDFVFCPYSIYVHSAYMEADKDIYHAKPQLRGDHAHKSIDHKIYSSRDIVTSLPVISNEFKLIGKIDKYNTKTEILTERKYRIKTVYQGQIYQLWAQYFCLIEMGYSVQGIEFYEFSTNKKIAIDLPCDAQRVEFAEFVKRFREFDPSNFDDINHNKCIHCVYSALCDKASQDNVYQ